MLDDGPISLKNMQAPCICVSYVISAVPFLYWNYRNLLFFTFCLVVIPSSTYILGVVKYFWPATTTELSMYMHVCSPPFGRSKKANIWQPLFSTCCDRRRRRKFFCACTWYFYAVCTQIAPVISHKPNNAKSKQTEELSQTYCRRKSVSIYLWFIGCIDGTLINLSGWWARTFSRENVYTPCIP